MPTEVAIIDASIHRAVYTEREWHKGLQYTRRT